MKGIAMYGHDFFVIKEGDDLIAESITRLFNTNQNERLKYPFMGVDLRRMVFELADEDSEGVVRDKIIEQIEVYEPRVNIVQLDVEKIPDENTLKIKVGFAKVNAPNDARFLEFNIELEEE